MVFDLPARGWQTGRGVTVVVENETEEVVTVMDKGRNFELQAGRT